MAAALWFAASDRLLFLLTGHVDPLLRQPLAAASFQSRNC